MSEMDAAVRAASAVLDVYYVKEPVGGAVHIVTDDYNLEDGSVVWCAEQARKVQAGRMRLQRGGA